MQTISDKKQSQTIHAYEGVNYFENTYHEANLNCRNTGQIFISTEKEDTRPKKFEQVGFIVWYTVKIQFKKRTLVGINA